MSAPSSNCATRTFGVKQTTSFGATRGIGLPNVEWNNYHDFTASGHANAREILVLHICISLFFFLSHFSLLLRYWITPVLFSALAEFISHYKYFRKREVLRG